MKSDNLVRKKKLIISLIVLISLGIINNNLRASLINNSNNLKYNNEINLKSAGFWEETDIYIDDISPTIGIFYPESNNLFGITAPSFNVEIYDATLDTMWYTLDNGLTNTTFTTNGTISQTLWDTVSNGTVTWTFYANDTAGNIGFAEVTFRKDGYAPIITINNPQDSDVIEATAPNFDISIDEPDLDKTWYSLDGGTNIIFTELTGTINQDLWDALPEGNVIIRFCANDSAGNIGFAEVTIRKDTYAPIITINNPQNSDGIGATAPNFDISIDEPNLINTWYSLDGGTNIIFTELTGTINQDLWDALPEGNVIIRFYANDSAGNISFQEVSVVKAISQPIPGYNFLLLLGVISTLTIIIIKKRLNHLKKTKR